MNSILASIFQGVLYRQIIYTGPRLLIGSLWFSVGTLISSEVRKFAITTTIENTTQGV